MTISSNEMEKGKGKFLRHGIQKGATEDNVNF